MLHHLGGLRAAFHCKNEDFKPLLHLTLLSVVTEKRLLGEEKKNRKWMYYFLALFWAFWASDLLY
mgnify:CR=1 FL=1